MACGAKFLRRGLAPGKPEGEAELADLFEIDEVLLSVDRLTGVVEFPANSKRR